MPAPRASGLEFSHQLYVRSSYGHPDGISVRNKLGALLALRRRRDRTVAGDGGSVLVFPRIELPGIIHFRRKTAKPDRALVFRVPGLPGVVAVGIFHYRHRRVDAASHRLYAGS